MQWPAARFWKDTNRRMRTSWLPVFLPCAFQPGGGAALESIAIDCKRCPATTAAPRTDPLKAAGQ